MGSQQLGAHKLFASIGIDLATKRDLALADDWACYSLNHDSPSQEIPIILVQRGPKNKEELKKKLKDFESYIVFWEEKNVLILKSGAESHLETIQNNSEFQRISSILKSAGVVTTQDYFDLLLSIQKAIDLIPNATIDFVNKGLFSTHYLRSRIFVDTRQDVDLKLDEIKEMIGNTHELLNILGWDITNSQNSYYDDKVSITVTDQPDFSTRQKKDEVSPSYAAVATLRKCQWAILTNGTKWRLYSNNISASSTNYFEITLDPAQDNITKYLIILFASFAFEKKDNKVDVDMFFEEGKNYSAELEENLAQSIMSSDGLFLDLIKGILDHDLKKIFTAAELDSAKQTALKIMYRIWFLAYAESRNLLPIKDQKYKPISLQSIRIHLDSFESDKDENSCWSELLRLFQGIRNGSPEHNLPQYNGNLFKHVSSIDGISIKNKFIASTLRGLLESDGEAIDYSNLGVRHFGNIFESLMEFSAKQAKNDIMLLEDKNGIKQVKSKIDSNYSYKKNDLYLISKSGTMSRKTSASFYTPDKIVEFLVNRGLEPIFEEREKKIADDLKIYKKSKSKKDLETCIGRILDIQVLDPAMGSGHFLVEALNKITVWATEILKKYPDHPLLTELESDQGIVISEQKNIGIIIDENLLTIDVLLKRKIMKRCIFGVDLNPIAVDLAKLSLWLDSFAIGVPLTYMDHHIKHGDSTIGMSLDDLKDKKNHTLDDWSPTAESNKMICDIVSSSDITIKQVQKSEDLHIEHNRLLEPLKRILDARTASIIDPTILPKKGKDEFIYRFGNYSKTETDDLKQAREIINDLVDRHHFFHFELEMMDAFTDSRRGFDLIVGNPPWEKIIPSDDEFFTPYDPTFKTLTPNTKKQERKIELLKDNEIKISWQEYENTIKEKNIFYGTYDMQSAAARDLWNLIMEKIFRLVTFDDGIFSLVIPSSILSNSSVMDMRKHILKKDILSLYVFENRKKIFPIHTSYRFVLLTVRNSDGPDKFPAGFYLHNLESLYDTSKENKFGELSKGKILSDPGSIIPETVGILLSIFEKICRGKNLDEGIGVNWSLEMLSRIRKTDDANLFLDLKGWPVHEGKTIHQYNHKWSIHQFTVDKKAGLQRLDRVKAFDGKCRQIHDCCRLIFRNISSPTNMRTVISTIIPPHTFHINSLHSIILKHSDRIILDSQYDKKIVYLCGIFNSLAFDFVARQKIQTNLATIIRTLPLPNNIHETRIAELAAKMIVGTPEFEGFAESLRIPNEKLTPAQRIETAAELDVLVALSYDLTKEEYATIIETFKLFKKNPTLYDLQEITWDNKNLKEFYGEMSELALDYFETIEGKQ